MQQEDLLAAAWHQAAFARSKRQERLETVLKRLRDPQEKRRATGHDQILAMVKELNAVFGGKVVKRSE